MILGKVGPICHPSIIFSIHIYRFPSSKNKGTIKNMDYSMEMDCPSIFLPRLLWREASDKHRSRSHRLKGSKVLLILLGYLHGLLHKHCWNLQRRFIPGIMWLRPMVIVSPLRIRGCSSYTHATCVVCHLEILLIGASQQSDLGHVTTFKTA